MFYFIFFKVIPDGFPVTSVIGHMIFNFFVIQRCFTSKLFSQFYNKVTIELNSSPN